VLVWDNCNTHLTAGMRRYIAERGWLTVCRLPPCALDLDLVEGIWSGLRRTPLADRAFADSQDLINAVRRGLRQLLYRYDVLDGCLVGTGPVPAPTFTASRNQGQWLPGVRRIGVCPQRNLKRD
jgi:hypothetical protein